MPNPLQKINELIPALPVKDIEFAKKFVEKRDWESLKDLTWSSLMRLENAYKRESLPQKYVGIDVDKVRELALLCNEYYYLIYPDDREPAEDEYDNEVEEDF